MTKHIRIGSTDFQSVKKRDYVDVHVYESSGKFLRVGPSKILTPEIALHRQLLKLGFPVPKILETGKMAGGVYFIETGMGKHHFGQIFAEDMKKYGRITDHNFQRFLRVCLEYAKAQITATVSRNWKAFGVGINYRVMLKELPKQAPLIRRVFKKVFTRLGNLPFVLSHGDMGPFNIYPKGVIDFAAGHAGVFGYDLATAIFMTEFFPTSKDYELRQWFRFTAPQKRKYFAVMDKLFLANKLPKLSDFLPELKLCRALWTAARMDHMPHLQAWRYDQLRKLLKAY